MKRRNIEEYRTDNDKDILYLLLPLSDYKHIEVTSPYGKSLKRAREIIIQFLISYRRKTGHSTIPYDILYRGMLVGIQTTPKGYEACCINFFLRKATGKLGKYINAEINI